MTNINGWSIAPNGRKAQHESGFTVEVEGNPADPHSVNPGKFPQGLSAIEQVRLLRMGVEAIAQVAKQGNGMGRKPQAASRRPVYTPPANKPARAKLSLKKKSEASPAAVEA